MYSFGRNFVNPYILPNNNISNNTPNIPKPSSVNHSFSLMEDLVGWNQQGLEEFPPEITIYDVSSPALEMGKESRVQIVEEKLGMGDAPSSPEEASSPISYGETETLGEEEQILEVPSHVPQGKPFTIKIHVDAFFKQQGYPLNAHMNENDPLELLAMEAKCRDKCNPGDFPLCKIVRDINGMPVTECKTCRAEWVIHFQKRWKYNATTRTYESEENKSHCTSSIHLYGHGEKIPQQTWRLLRLSMKIYDHVVESNTFYLRAKINQSQHTKRRGVPFEMKTEKNIKKPKNSSFTPPEQNTNSLKTEIEYHRLLEINRQLLAHNKQLMEQNQLQNEQLLILVQQMYMMAKGPSLPRIMPSSEGKIAIRMYRTLRPASETDTWGRAFCRFLESKIPGVKYCWTIRADGVFISVTETANHEQALLSHTVARDWVANPNEFGCIQTVFHLLKATFVLS